MIIVAISLGLALTYLVLRWLESRADEYSKDIPGKYHLIETLPDGSEKAVGWFLTKEQADIVNTHSCEGAARLMPTNYKPKNK